MKILAPKMAQASSQLLCDVGRPCPNFQRLIEYVEPVEEDEGAAGDNPQLETDLCRRNSRNSASFPRWNPRTSRLMIRNPRLPNYPLRRRPKLRDIYLNESSAEMTKMENGEEPKQLQAKTVVKIKPNCTNQAAQLDVELRRLLTQYEMSASDLDRRLQQLSLRLED